MHFMLDVNEETEYPFIALCVLDENTSELEILSKEGKQYEENLSI